MVCKYNREVGHSSVVPFFDVLKITKVYYVEGLGKRDYSVQGRCK